MISTTTHNGTTKVLLMTDLTLASSPLRMMLSYPPCIYASIVK